MDIDCNSPPCDDNHAQIPGKRARLQTGRLDATKMIARQKKDKIEFPVVFIKMALSYQRNYDKCHFEGCLLCAKS